ncbi:hypothetical protein ACVMBZ_000151 [Bradyrhizobium liaoningense]
MIISGVFTADIKDSYLSKRVFTTKHREIFARCV